MTATTTLTLALSREEYARLLRYAAGAKKTPAEAAALILSEGINTASGAAAVFSR